MARPLRIQYPGAVYHVTCRGNEKREIFRGDEDKRLFLRILTQSVIIYSVKLHAYVLMDNHFHLLVETPLGNLGEFMRHCNITYTGSFNRRHKRVGHLYQGRYKSILVEKEAYLSTLSRYIHLNPIRIKSIDKLPAKKQLEEVLRYPWSSLPGYLDRGKRSGMIDYSLSLAPYGGDTDKGRNAYQKQLVADIAEGLEVKGDIFAQSVIGGDEFIQWVKNEFLGDKEQREQPSVGQIKQHRQKEAILELIEQETGKSLESLKKEKGELRRMAMELLYRYGGIKGPEVGELFGVDYSVVSQERKRFRESQMEQGGANKLVARLEVMLSTTKI